MDLIFFTEARFIKDIYNNMYNEGGSLNLQLWNRYLLYFTSITIVARVLQDNDYIGNINKIASGPRVNFVELPYFVGIKRYIYENKIVQIIKSTIKTDSAYILRVPGQIGKIAAAELNKRKIPYGVEIVGDPYDVFSKDSFKFPFIKLIRNWSCMELKNVVNRAFASLYVTKLTLQKRYPPKKGTFTTNASNVVLDKKNIVDIPKIFKKKKVFNLLSIGSLSQLYKAPDVVIKSINELKKRNIYCNLKWLGSGKYLLEMADLAKELQIDNQIRFMGYVSDINEKIKLFDQSDFFIHISRTEGLPRAVIEAMGRGLPIIGTNVGGIPELIDAEVLIPKNNYMALADKLEELINNDNLTNKLAQNNLNKSHDYVEDLLNERRGCFYNELKKSINQVRYSQNIHQY